MTFPKPARLIPPMMAALISAAVPCANGESDRFSGELKEVQNLNLDFLKAVTCVTASRDGKFLYATAFNGNVVAAFNRDAESGEISFARSNESEELDAAVSVAGLCFSPDGKFVYVADENANSIVVFKQP
jgi:6-phosphogluconolactonase (cycloisomerase 2 family)